MDRKMNRRTPRGAGIRKLPSGRYQITFRDAAGKKHRESFDREKDARSTLDERRTAVRNREYVAPAKIPTVAAAARSWLEGQHSIRKVRVPDKLCLALKKWKLQCPPSKWDLVFPRTDGRPQDRKTTWRAFDAAIKKANENDREDEKLRRLTVHSLRHSFASIHLMNGTPIPEVSAMLGHANVNITLAVYTHFIPKMQTDSATRLAAAIFSGDQVGHLKTARTT
jgi:hypothetical protein